MGPDVVVVAPPLLDADFGFDAIPKPLQAQVLVAEFPVERFVGAILPRLPRVDECGLDLCRLEPAKNRGRDELGAIVGAQVLWRAVHADELQQPARSAHSTTHRAARISPANPAHSPWACQVVVRGSSAPERTIGALCDA